MLAMQEAPYEGDIVRSGFSSDPPPESRRAETTGERGRREASEYHAYMPGVHADEQIYG